MTKIIFNDDPLDSETELIKDKLAEANKKGVLTVNSQPAVNCAPCKYSPVSLSGHRLDNKTDLRFVTRTSVES